MQHIRYREGSQGVPTRQGSAIKVDHSAKAEEQITAIRDYSADWPKQGGRNGNARGSFSDQQPSSRL